MAKAYQLRLLEEDADAWNEWRQQNPDITPDLSRAYLHSYDLSGRDLSRANLRDAFLNQAVLDNCDLTHADLRHAKLRFASLRMARLFHTKLNHADLHRADLYRAQAREAQCTQAKLTGVDFTEADLSQASMNVVTLDNSKFNLAEFNGASLCHASLRYVDLLGASLDGADLSYASLAHSVIEDASFHKARFVEAHIEHAQLVRSNFDEAEFSDTTFTHVDFSRALGLSNCIHRGPSTLDTATLELSDHLPEPFMRGVELAEERILNYLYGISLTISFAQPAWIPLVPFSTILRSLVTGKFLVESLTEQVVIRLRSLTQFEGSLDALLPVLAALEAIDPDAVASIQVVKEKKSPIELASLELKDFLESVNARLCRLALKQSAQSSDTPPEQHPLSATSLPADTPPSEEEHPDASEKDLFRHWLSLKLSCEEPPGLPENSLVLYESFMPILERYQNILALNGYPRHSSVILTGPISSSEFPD